MKILNLSERDIAELVTVNDAVNALREMLPLESEGGAFNVEKALGVWGGGSIHALGAGAHAAGFACFKCWINTPAGASASLILFDTAAGQIIGRFEAFTLGSLRTSAICAVASDVLARQDAQQMALVGTGRQALLQIAAIATVRKLNEVRGL